MRRSLALLTTAIPILTATSLFVSSPAPLAQAQDNSGGVSDAQEEKTKDAGAQTKDFLVQGNIAYAKGDYDTAVELWENTESRVAYLTRKYNAGVGLLRAGKPDDAIDRFEEVSAHSDGDLQRRSLSNLGFCHFQKARTLASEIPDEAPSAVPDEEIDTRIEGLQKAANAYRTASTFYRRVDPSDEDTRQNVGVAKTVLIALLDRVAQLEAEKKRREEEKALAEPAKLIVELIRREKVQLGTARALEAQKTSTRRIAVRRLKKQQNENRQLTEKLQFHINEKVRKAEESAAAPPDDDLEQSLNKILTGMQGQLQTLQAQTSGQPNEQLQALEQQITQLQTILQQLPQMTDEQKEQLRQQIAAATGQEKNEKASPEEIEAWKRGAAAIARAVEAQARAEVSYGKHDVSAAIPAHQSAIAALREARTAFPLDLGQLVKEGLQAQTGVLEATRGVDRAQTGGLSETNKGSGFGSLIVNGLKSKVLAPIAKKLAPSYETELALIAETEDDVIWVASLLEHANIPASDPAQAGPAAPGAGAAPALTEEDAKKLSEQIQAEAKTLSDQSKLAKESLEKADVSAALPAENDALDTLKRIAELLPKPPKSIPDRIREVLQKQEEAKGVTEQLSSLEGDSLGPAAASLASSQGADGKTTVDIAADMKAPPGGAPGQTPSPHGQPQQGQDPRMAEALPYVEQGAEEIFSSQQALDKTQVSPAAESIDRGIEALEKALEILSGKQDEENKDDQDQDQDQQNQDQQNQDQNAGQMSPRQARALKREMDDEREDAEKELFRGPRKVVVDKDW